MKKDYLTKEELAKRWGVSIDLLNKWRCQGKGPKYYKLGGVKYPIKEVEKFENELKKCKD